MALIVCPECNGTVSDKATMCPHCGYPMATKDVDYTNIVFKGETIDITNVLRRLRDEHDGTLAEFELIDAYDNTSIPYGEANTKTMMKMVINNYEKLYGEPPVELPSCLSVATKPGQPKCPTCGSTNIESINLSTRAAATVLFGVVSKTARSQFHCKSCGYKW
ncbi:MAG: hypothetical protein ACI3XJ_12650 [Oscillospiraceae bacterium]